MAVDRETQACGSNYRGPQGLRNRYNLMRRKKRKSKRSCFKKYQENHGNRILDKFKYRVCLSRSNKRDDYGGCNLNLQKVICVAREGMIMGINPTESKGKTKRDADDFYEINFRSRIDLSQ